MVDEHDCHAVCADEAGERAIQEPADTNLRLQKHDGVLRCVGDLATTTAGLVLHLLKHGATARVAEELHIARARGAGGHVQLDELPGAVCLLDRHEEAHLELAVRLGVVGVLLGRVGQWEVSDCDLVGVRVVWSWNVHGRDGLEEHDDGNAGREDAGEDDHDRDLRDVASVEFELGSRGDGWGRGSRPAG